MNRFALVPALALAVAGCIVEGAPPPLKEGDGVDIDPAKGTVSLDPERVPMPVACEAGQVVRRTASGWECATPSELAAGEGLAIEDGRIRADFGSADGEIARGSHHHDGRYRRADLAIAWSELDPATLPEGLADGDDDTYTDDHARAAVSWNSVLPSVRAADEWPGTIPYARVQGGPTQYTDAQARAAVSWNTIAPTVTSPTAWPGTLPYERVTGAPAPYTDDQARAAVSWTSVQGSVASDAAWPGKVPYAQVTGAPAVDWGTVGPTVAANAAWPGTMPWSRVTGAPSFAAASDLTALAAQASRRTTAALTLYVRTDGSDTACDGLANTPAGAGTCAVATLQRAMDLVPTVVAHAVTISIAAGTYRAATAGSNQLVVAKIVEPPAGSILIEGVGSVVLSGATATAPTVAVGATGITARAPVVALTLRNLTLERFTTNGIVAARAAVIMENMTVRNVGSAAILCQQNAYCTFSGTTSVTGSYIGIWARLGSIVDTAGTITASSNSSIGLLVDNASLLQGPAAVNLTSNGYAGLWVANASSATFSGPLTATGNTSGGLVTLSGATIATGASVTVSVPNANTWAVQAGGNASFTAYANAPVSLSCATNTGTSAIVAHGGATVTLTGASSIAIDGCAAGFIANVHGAIHNDALGPRTITNTTTPVYIVNLSVYTRGGFPAATGSTCIASSVCY